MNNRQATVKALVGHSLVSYPTAAAWEEQCADLVVAPQYLWGNCLKIEAKMNMEMADLNPYVRTLGKGGNEGERGEGRGAWGILTLHKCNFYFWLTAQFWITTTSHLPIKRRSPTPSAWTEAL